LSMSYLSISTCRSELRKALESAVNRCASVGNRIWSQFWSCHQRFFKQLW